MLFKFMEDMLEKLVEAYKDLEDVTDTALKTEKDYMDNLIEREKALALADGQEMDDEDLELIVNAQMQNTPNKRRVEDQIRKIKEVMKNG